MTMNLLKFKQLKLRENKLTKIALNCTQGFGRNYSSALKAGRYIIKFVIRIRIFVKPNIEF